MLKRLPEQLLSAIQDFGFYRKIFRQPLRDTLLFLLYFSILVALLSTIISFLHLVPDFNRFISWAEVNAPALSVNEGILQIAADQPLVLTYQGEEKWFLVFDTTGVYQDTSDFNDPVMLFSREELVLRIRGQVQSYSWNDFGTFTLNSENINFYAKVLLVFLAPLGFLFYLLVTLVSKSLQALLISPLAYSVAGTYEVRLPFRSSFAIALYALVPATALDLLVKASGMNISYFLFIYISAALIYTYLATKKCVIIE